MRQFRNKPKHALYGVTAGASSFVTSVASGFEGLAVRLLSWADQHVSDLSYGVIRLSPLKELKLGELLDSSKGSVKVWLGMFSPFGSCAFTCFAYLLTLTSQCRH